MRIANAFLRSCLLVCPLLACVVPAQVHAQDSKLAARRAGIAVICHRGAVEFAHENTLEAYRAAFALGADGNEIDIRATKDGMLVCFHDDMLDHLLEAYGDVADYTWEQLRRFRFRRPGPFGEHCRIPTLKEVFQLHRRHGGLMHLDIKRPALAKPVMRLLDEMQLWDHVIHAPAGVDDLRIKRGRYKASLYLDRSEVDPQAISAALKKPGDSIIVEDPRGVAVALGRKFRRPSDQPVAPVKRISPPTSPPQKREKLLEILGDASDWNQPSGSAEQQAQSAKRILHRAEAADALAAIGSPSKATHQALEARVRRRSLHRSWRYHGLDGAAAFRALARLRASQTVELARFCLWRDDPAVEPVVNPQWNNPRSWTDWRTKTIIFPELADFPGPKTERLCRDYLRLSDEQARKIGIPQFEAAARTLLSISPQEKTAANLMKHRLQVVRGRAILFCLSRIEQPWARRALTAEAPHALEYVFR